MKGTDSVQLKSCASEISCAAFTQDFMSLLNLLLSRCSEVYIPFKINYAPQSYGCEEILDDMNQTGLMQAYIQETKDS